MPKGNKLIWDRHSGAFCNQTMCLKARVKFPTCITILVGLCIVHDDVHANANAIVADHHSWPAISLRTSVWPLLQKEQRGAASA
jgi:hypothetical protein